MSNCVINNNTETTVCCEYGRIISAEEQHEHVIEEYGGDSLGVFKTCVDCCSIKDLYWIPPDHGELYDSIRRAIIEGEGDSLVNGLPSLTPTAMDKVCEMLKKSWGGEHDE